MSLTLTAQSYAIVPGLTMQFYAKNGTPPYAFSLASGGSAGGSINPSSGVYSAPLMNTGTDTVVVTDALSVTVSQMIKVCNPTQLVCDILQNQLALGDGRVYLWDQKIFQPNDYNLYIAVSVVNCKPFANGNEQVANSGLQSQQYVSMQATLGLNLISRGPDALNRKEEVLAALNSNYAEMQQEINGFYIASLPTKFINLSMVDGAAIPYRFHIDVNMLYTYVKVQQVPYDDTFSNVNVVTEA